MGELTFWEVDILGVDILGVDILGVDILGVDILGRTHASVYELSYVSSATLHITFPPTILSQRQRITVKLAL